MPLHQSHDFLYKEMLMAQFSKHLSLPWYWNEPFLQGALSTSGEDV